MRMGISNRATIISLRVLGQSLGHRPSDRLLGTSSLLDKYSTVGTEKELCSRVAPIHALNSSLRNKKQNTAGTQRATLPAVFYISYCRQQDKNLELSTSSYRQRQSSFLLQL